MGVTCLLTCWSWIITIILPSKDVTSLSISVVYLLVSLILISLFVLVLFNFQDAANRWLHLVDALYLWLTFLRNISSINYITKYNLYVDKCLNSYSMWWLSSSLVVGCLISSARAKWPLPFFSGDTILTLFILILSTLLYVSDLKNIFNLFVITHWVLCKYVFQTPYMRLYRQLHAF
jgi:hypothetical protein